MQHFKIIILFLLTTVFVACHETPKPSTPKGKVQIDLTAHGKPFSLILPDTNMTKLSIEEIASGALEVRVGDFFGIAIHEQSCDLDLKRSDIANDDVNKLRNYRTNEKKQLYWESELAGKTEMHFMLNRTIGTAEYCFEDLRTLQGFAFTPKQIQVMYDCCMNVAVPPAPAN